MNPDSPCFGLLTLLLDHFSGLGQALATGIESSSPFPLSSLTDGKRARTEAPGKYPLTEAHMNSSEKLQFYKEKAADCHGPLSKHEALSSQESKSKKRAFEEPEKEQSSSSQSSKQKYVCLAVEDWDLLNSY